MSLWTVAISAASKAVLMPTFEPGPQAHLAPLWRAVYGGERVGLPGLAELVAVLTEMGLDPSVEPAGTPQRLVNRFGTVGRRDHDQIGACLQPVHQRQE